MIEYDSALFEIEVLDQGGPLIFLPSQLDFRREIDKMLSSFVMTVSSVPHLSSETLPSRSLYEYTSLVEVEDVNEDALEARQHQQTRLCSLVPASVCLLERRPRAFGALKAGAE